MSIPGINGPTDVCNLSLSLLRGNLRITNFTTGTDATTKLLQLVYPLKQNELLRARPWTFTKQQAALTGVIQNPNPVWAFSYVPPTDMLFPRRILSVMQSTFGTLNTPLPGNSIVDIGTIFTPQVDSTGSIVPFDLMEGLIYTNMPQAVLEYSQNVLTETSYPARFIWALAYAVAAEIAPSLSGGDPFNIMPKLMAEATKRLNEAAAEEGNSKVAKPPDSEFILGRGGFWW